MELVRAVGVGIVGTLLAVTLSRYSGGYGLLTGIATGCLLLMLLLGQADTLSAFFRELMGVGELSSAYVDQVVRILGLTCLTEAGSRICRDGGQGNIALKVELCGRTMILFAAWPAVREALRAATAVLSELGA